MKDSELWRHVTRDVMPLRPHRHPTPESEPPELPALNGAGQGPDDLSSPPIPRPQLPLKVGSVAAMDARTARRFARGDMPVDARIDLHGLTLEQAHDALVGFIRRGYARGMRCLIVVTGKGGALGAGRIRREAPLWLARPDLRPLILAVTEARRHHGGAGALYVLLKRPKE
jgi:DNA-nicking Smr family endonuclease